MQCEKCGSDNTQRLQMTYEGGTQDINVKSHTVSVSSINRALGIGGSITKSAGTSQSVLAQKVAPPQRRSLKGAFIAIAAGLFVCSFAGLGGTILGLVLIAAGVYFGYSAIQFNSKEWPDLLKHWTKCWICNKCGHIYHQA